MVARRAFSGKRADNQKCELRPGLARELQGVRRRKQVKSALARMRLGLLGAAGRTRAPHVMQFRPVGVEGPGEKLAPEGADFGEGTWPAGAAAGRGDQEMRSDARHDESCLVFGDFSRAKRSFPALTWSFGRKLLKLGFNCPDPHPVW
jgi:hypothetical protein